MKKIRKCCVIVLLVVLFPANIFAQERRDKGQQYYNTVTREED